MKTTPMARTRRAGAGAAVGALVLSGLVFAAPAQAASKVIPSNLVDQSETRSTGHNEFGSDGVHVYTEGATSTDKAAGYFDVNLDLADAGEPKLSWSGSAARPGSQLVTDFNNDGNIDGILVGEPVNTQTIEGETVPDWWVSNGGAKQFVKDGSPSQLGDAPVGGSGSNFHGTLDQWRSAFPDAKVFQAGWSLGSGVLGNGTINSITVGGDKYFFEESPAVEEVTLYPNDVDTSSTREKGHNDFRPTSGVNVYTDPIVPNFPGDAGKYEGYVNKAAGMITIDEELTAVGEPTMEFRTLSGSIPPGLWLNLDINGDGDADGTIIKEPAYGNDWWLNDTEGPLAEYAPIDGGGSGSNLHGRLAEWRATLPAGTTIVTSGWSLGAGVEGDYIIDAITVGLKKFEFTGKNRAPVAEEVSGETTVGASVMVDLVGSDPDGDELTYEASTPDEGTVELDGDELTFTTVGNFVGTTSVDYTVTDGRGGSASSTVTIEVGKAASTINYSISPTKRTTKTSLKLTATAKAPAGKLKYGIVEVYIDGKFLKKSRVDEDGVVSIWLGKLTKGSHKVTTTFLGSGSVLGSSKTKTVKVVKG